jgi:hypothetical protein
LRKPGYAVLHTKAVRGPTSAERPIALFGDLMSSSPSPQPPSEVQEEVLAIFRALKRGVGREKVNDRNVNALIALARERGEAQLEYLLREWRSDCGENVDATELQSLPKFPPPN